MLYPTGGQPPTTKGKQPMNTLQVTNNNGNGPGNNGMTFNVLIIRKGETYGLNNCLIHDDEMPMVEFYDTRFDHSPLGQFIARYDADTLVEDDGFGPFELDGGNPNWTVGDVAMDRVTTWLRDELQVKA
jgi:hypothetical protein